ncbi:MAG TPA: S53 family peptidase [Candidatus Limnocylindrales bacterium]|nr:S53 family peptidase [Candidatus Limnocylindrales bacterium]
MNRHLRTLTAGVVSAVMIVALVGGTATAASGRAVLAGSVPSWAHSSAYMGRVSGTESVGFRVYLGWRDAGAAAALAYSVSDPRSAAYGHFLSPAQFRKQFAPSQASVGAVQRWLRSQGFRLDYTPSNNLYVAAEGTVAQAAAAFGTTFGEYRVQGHTLRSPQTALSVPASLAGTVTAVVGLDESAALVHPDATGSAPPPAVFKNAPPCSSYWAQLDTTTAGPDGTTVPEIYGTAQPYAPCGYTPQQLRSAYGVPSSLTGAGVTVAIIDAYASPTIVQDVDAWSANRGIAPLEANQFRQVVAPGTFRRPQNPAQDPQGWSGEETLDVEAVHGMAPGATIVYVGAANAYQDLDAAMNHVVDAHLADMVSNSYGFIGEALPFGYIKPLNDIFIQAAAEGIGIYFSSGDDGDETGGIAANASSATPDWSASSPWVTAVGGTSLGVAADGSIAVETGWETGKSSLTSDGTWNVDPPGAYLYGSGGGTSRLFTQPAYQAGVVPSSLSKYNDPSGPAMRVVPDVAAVADPNTGYLIGQTQTFPDGTTAYSEYRVGGTSLASPIVTGLMADLQQHRGQAIGFANPLLYSMGAAAFHDVQHVADAGVIRSDYVNGTSAADGYVYSFRSFDFTTGLTIKTTVGYDRVTGLGSINGSQFFK